MSSNDIIEQTIELSHHEEAFYLSAEFWVSIAFVLTILIILTPGLKAIKKLIDNRISRIKNELNEAETLKMEAQQLYSDYERKLTNIKKEIEDIINEENIIISENKEYKLRELDSMIQKKEMEINGKIELASEQVKKELNKLIADKTLSIINTLINQKITKSMHNELIDNTINNITKMEP